MNTAVVSVLLNVLKGGASGLLAMVADAGPILSVLIPDATQVITDVNKLLVDIQASLAKLESSAIAAAKPPAA